MKKNLFVSFLIYLVSFSVFQTPIAFAAPPTCDNFQNPSYTITNNLGNPNFILGDPIQTRLSLFVKNALVGDPGFVQVYFVMDVSNSMRTFGKMQAAKDALQRALSIVAGNPNNKVGLVTFTASVYNNVVPLTNDFASVAIAIDALNYKPAGTGTDIGAGLDRAGALFKSDGPPPINTQRFILLTSDGDGGTPPTAGSVPSDVTVYTVGLGADVVEQPLKDIAYGPTASGSGDGTYTYSDSSDIVQKFDDITNGIITLKLKVVSIFSFTRDDKTHTSLTSTSPLYSFYDSSPVSPTYGLIKWADLGTLLDGQKKDIDINYGTTAVTAPFGPVPLNKSNLVVEYTISGMACSQTFTLPVIQVNIGLACSDTIWTPVQNPATVCSTQMIPTTGDCTGNPGTPVPGTLSCAQCSDGVDNDGDFLVDFGNDPGCSSPSDNSEKPFYFRFIGF